MHNLGGINLIALFFWFCSMPGTTVNPVGNRWVPSGKPVVSLLEPIGFLRGNQPFTPFGLLFSPTLTTLDTHPNNSRYPSLQLMSPCLAWQEDKGRHLTVLSFYIIHYCFNLKEFSILLSSAENDLSTFSRCSTVEQLCITVEWSRPPISCPIREAGIFVYF